MSAKARILYDMDAVAASAVTSSSATSGNPANSVLHDHPGKIWQASGDVGEWVQFYSASGLTFNQVALFNHNLSSTATVLLQGSTDANWTIPDDIPFNETIPLTVDADDNILPRANMFFAATSYNYWRVFINDVNNADGKIRVGRICAGVYYEVSRNFSDGSRFTLKDPSTFSKVPGSVENITIKTAADGQASRFRQVRVDFSLTTEAEFEKWEAIFSKIGNSRPCVLSLDPDNEPTKKTAYCYLLTDMDIVWNLADNFDIVTLVFEEKTR